MKFKFILVILATAIIAGCSTTPTADNYQQYMNDPNVGHGSSGDVDSMMSNQVAWRHIKITEMSSVRRTAKGGYATNPSQGLLTVRAVIVNSGDKPAQGNWRCRFFDSNNMPLYENQSNQQATTATGLGWHSMVVYPLTSKSQTADANVIHCQALTSDATNYRVEFHDTHNDITKYHR